MVESFTLAPRMHSGLDFQSWTS